MGDIDTDFMLSQRYRLVRRIAVGGMGSVWEAEDTVLHRQVALKLLSEELSADERFADRFRREAQSAAGLAHPNVASVFDYGEDDGRPFIVMELVEGETLAERLQREGRLDPSEAVRIAGAIASALEAAHRAGIVHRDVKPGNVMLTGAGEVRVLDFGIAAAAGAPLTATGARMGTATYLSPEQARGEPPTPASDVYSLGVVLYEILTGRPPFTGDTPVGVATQHVHDDPAPVRSLAPDVPATVATACERALAKYPAARPPSAAAFAASLGAPQTSGPATAVLPPIESTAVLPTEGVAAGGPARGPSRPGHRRGRAVGVSMAAMALALVGLIIALAVVLGGGDGGQPKGGTSGGTSGAAQVAVPDVSDMKRGDAEKLLRDKGFQIGDTVEVEGKHDRVVRTDPPPGTLVSPGSTVTLYVGSGKGNEGHGGGEGGGGGGD